MELLNLFVHPLVIPDVVVGPSRYAIRHESVAKIEEISKNSSRGASLLKVIIPPSVDVDHFSSSNERESETLFHPSCREQFDLHSNVKSDSSFSLSSLSLLSPLNRALINSNSFNCITIGFIARLSSEKNPGLFLLAARELLSRFPLLRFTVVGDGPLKTRLQNMGERLKISHAIHYAGWVDYAIMPSVLRGIDIIVNPSVRGWSETFCIANIEAMSVGIPVVTLGVGGVGEYVHPPPLTHTHTHTHTLSNNAEEGYQDEDFTIGTNAVLVNEAHPLAIANAVAILVTNASLRYDIGFAGQKTVRRHFTVKRQMTQYAKLYSILVNRRF
jgi:glycosyltransferase involved in cell wall biosynthesis